MTLVKMFCKNNSMCFDLFSMQWTLLWGAQKPRSGVLKLLSAVPREQITQDPVVL